MTYTIEDNLLTEAERLAKKRDEAVQKRLERKKEMFNRGLEMARLHLDEGWPLQKVADKYGVSRQRVHQIIFKL